MKSKIKTTAKEGAKKSKSFLGVMRPLLEFASGGKVFSTRSRSLVSRQLFSSSGSTFSQTRSRSRANTLARDSGYSTAEESDYDDESYDDSEKVVESSNAPTMAPRRSRFTRSRSHQSVSDDPEPRRSQTRCWRRHAPRTKPSTAPRSASQHLRSEGKSRKHGKGRSKHEKPIPHDARS
jgi:hypothetical protein